VLLVDDDNDLSEVAEQILVEARYRVVRAANGRQGLAAVRSLAPDLIVTDVMMPEMDGLQFLSALSPGHAPVVVVSGFSVFEKEARSRGAVSFLRKPYHAEELLAAITQAQVSRESVERIRLERERSHRAND
jgi:CheY-like chemotaxis protein